MVTSTPEAGDKSLLLQTVALFETLLAKIHDLQGQNEKIRSRLEEEGRYDALVLELESARKDIQVKLFYWIINHNFVTFLSLIKGIEIIII